MVVVAGINGEPVSGQGGQLHNLADVARGLLYGGNSGMIGQSGTGGWQQVAAGAGGTL